MTHQFKKNVTEFMKRLEANISSMPPKPIKRKISEVAESKTSTAKKSKPDSKPAISFTALAKIVGHLKTRHQNGSADPLSFEELLQETKLTGLSAGTVSWLEEEALLNNVKISVSSEGRFSYKPDLNVKGPGALKKLLASQFSEGDGAITMEAIEDSMSNGKKVLQAIEDSVVVVTTSDKKQLVFAKVAGMEKPVKEDIVSLWRGISIEGLSEAWMVQLLQMNSIQTSDYSANRRVIVPQKTTKGRRNGRKSKTELKHNAHVAQHLVDYGERN